MYGTHSRLIIRREPKVSAICAKACDRRKVQGPSESLKEKGESGRLIGAVHTSK